MPLSVVFLCKRKMAVHKVKYSTCHKGQALNNMFGMKAEVDIIGQVLTSGWCWWMEPPAPGLYDIMKELLDSVVKAALEKKNLNQRQNSIKVKPAHMRISWNNKQQCNWSCSKLFALILQARHYSLPRAKHRTMIPNDGYQHCSFAGDF